MTKVAKRVRANQDAVERHHVYSLAEGIALLQKTQAAKFDETVEVAVNLGIDPKKSDQAVRGAVSLPNGTGRSARVIAFVKDPGLQEEARAAGATEVGDDDLVKKVSDGWTDFDVAVASPDMMGKVGRLGKVLGPQGKMPTPKSGTVTPDVANAVREFAAGKIEFRADSGGTVHAPVGKRSFEAQKIEENVRHFIHTLSGMRPTAAKGTFIERVNLTTTMGPGVRVSLD